jgi:hypothetical protein
MAQLESVEQPKVAGFVDSNYSNANKRRIEKEEEELQKLVDGETTEEDQKVETKEASEEEAKDEKLSGEERTYKKRYSDLRNHLNKQSEELKKLKTQLENAQERGEIRPPKSDEDIANWAEKYPDVAAIVETIAEKKAQEKFNLAEGRLQELDRMSAEAERNKNEDAIRDAHPDFDDLRESDAFHDWAGEQPKWVQDAIYENSDDPRSVVRVIDLYKVDNNMDTKSRKKSSKEAASAVVTKRTTKPESNDSTGRFSESQVNSMSVHEYEKNSDAIMEAMRTGKFVYDMTGGAR